MTVSSERSAAGEALSCTTDYLVGMYEEDAEASKSPLGSRLDWRLGTGCHSTTERRCLWHC